jgi:hypothetical protein
MKDIGLIKYLALGYGFSTKNIQMITRDEISFIQDALQDTKISAHEPDTHSVEFKRTVVFFILLQMFGMIEDTPQNMANYVDFMKRCGIPSASLSPRCHNYDNLPIGNYKNFNSLTAANIKQDDYNDLVSAL